MQSEQGKLGHHRYAGRIILAASTLGVVFIGGLALGVAEENKLPDLACKSLTVRDQDGKPRVALLESGDIQVAGASIVVPVGTILPWHQALTKGTPLPLGWVRCDGPVKKGDEGWIPDSTIDLSRIPNLNGARRFLRGGKESGIDEEWSTALPKKKPLSVSIAHGGVHGHSIPGTDQGKPKDNGFQNGGDHRTFTINIGGGEHDHTASISGGDDETRPLNMSVIWIIRVK